MIYTHENSYDIKYQNILKNRDIKKSWRYR